jgi:cysteine dioxygenase
MTKQANMHAKAVNNISSLDKLCRFLENGKYEEVLAQIEELQISAKDVDEFAFWNNDYYTRNCIARSDEYELLLLCWEPGQASAIHSHNEQECWVKVISGTFRETIFSFDELTNSMVELESKLLGRTDASSMENQSNFHRLSTTGSERAMSLHLYMKPITHCEVYNVNDQKLTLLPTSYYSMNGKIV